MFGSTHSNSSMKSEGDVLPCFLAGEDHCHIKSHVAQTRSQVQQVVVAQVLFFFDFCMLMKIHADDLLF